jgi:Subtilase family
MATLSTPATGWFLRRLSVSILAAIVATGCTAILLSPPWGPVAPAVADDAGGDDSGGGDGGDGDGGDSDGGDDSDGDGGDNDGGDDSDGEGGDNDGGDDSDGEGGDDSGPGSSDSGPDGEEHDDDGDDAATTGVGNASGGDAERGNREYIRGEVIVANLSDQAKGEIRGLGFVVLEERPLEFLGLTVTRLRIPRQLAAPAARTLLAARYPDLLVDLNALYRPQAQVVLPAPDYAARLMGWGQAPEDCGAGVRIGMVDTAVDNELVSLNGAKLMQRSFLPNGIRPAGRDHGTAVAAILVGQPTVGGRGLLPAAEISVAAVFVIGDDGGPVAEALALVGGLDWLMQRGVAVINLSLAGDPNALISFALKRVAARQIIVVSAAGNSGRGAPPAFPAAEPTVIGVTALDIRSQPYANANRGDYVDFAAPGVRIWTPTPHPAGSYNSGTSFAAPFVTAALAAQMSTGGVTEPARITAALAATAIDLGVPGKDPVYGWGLIQSANPCAAPTQ